MTETVTVEKEVYEAVLRNSLRVNELEKENERLKKLNQRLQRTQARQFRDNQNLQIKAEKAKDVVDFDKARKIKQLKEVINEMLSELVDENDVTSLGLAEYFSQELLLKLREVLK